MSKTASFYRAVNLRSDIQNPERLAHYHPTSRSLPVVEAVLGRDPSMVIAAYGSGKSLAAGVGAILVANDAPSRNAVEHILPKVKQTDKALHQRLTQRLTSRAKGRVIVLTGHVPDLAREIAHQTEATGALKTLDKVLNWLATDSKRVDHIAIIWDEFGRHLESLVADGRSRDLDFVQRLAEWAARAETPSVSLTLLSHQNLLAYAGGLNQTSRNEWRKIEGRFRQIRFVEDSRELYKLVASRIAERRGTPPRGLDPGILGAVAKRATEAGWFDGATDVEEVERLVRDAWPVSAGVLQCLPRLAARVGQNERTLFSFLEEADLSHPVGFEDLYRGFSDAMRSDIGAGGTHRRWIETESARGKAENEIEREAIAAACLLQLGADGERRKLSRKTLEAALVSRGLPQANAEATVGKLIARKLLLHRRVNDDVSVWHGVDVDVAGRLAEERARRADAFDPIAFLSERHPAPIVRATRHNAKFGTTRYLSGRYVLADRLAAEPPLGSEWGEVLYVLAETQAEIDGAFAVARASTRERTLFVVPTRSLSLVDVALELACLETLRADDSLIAEDPLVSVEVDELLAVARRHLATVLHRLTTDRPTAAKWLHCAEELSVTAERPASIVASDLMDRWYPLTPRIANDQLMRQRVSRQMNTARVRLLTRLMESSDKPWLGYGREDTSVEASIYRTVLERPGLHRDADGAWGFASPDEVGDPGLKQAWEATRAFFTEPSDAPKRVSDLVSTLSGPPIGVPSGVLPVLVMAGYRAFARNVSLRSDGAYVADILGFDANAMFADPQRHDVIVHDGSEPTLRYLSELAYVFSHQRRAEGDEALRFAHDAFERWRGSLPDGARRSRRLSPKAQSLMRALTEAAHPHEFFLRLLPDLFGGVRRSLDQVAEAVEAVRNEIDGLVEGYLDEAVRVLGEVFRVGDGDAIAGLQSWVACLDVDALMRRDDLRLTDKAILRIARDTINGRYTPASLARAISSILLQRGVEQWQDTTAGQYAMLLRECRTRIEDAALLTEIPDKRLAPIIRDRIKGLQSLLARLEDNLEPRRTAAGGTR